MNPFYFLAIATVVAFFTTPVTIFLAKRFRILDFPWRPHPAILHSLPIPRAGGLATFSAILFTYLLLDFFNLPLVLDKHIVGILLAGFIVVVVGVLDDKYDINPYIRLLTNIVAVAIIVGFGVGITWFTNPFGGQIRLDTIIFHFNFPGVLPFGLFSGQHSIVLLADLFAFLWIIWVMNALNWSSGVDGQLSGIAAIGFVALGVATMKYLNSDSSQLAPAALSFISGGAYLGFLAWSFYPQKIMPGYGGSALAGMILASLSILAGAKLATTGLLLIIPITDGLWAVIRRLLAKKSPVWGDKEHLHHQLLALGWKKWQIAGFYYLLCAGFAFLAIALDNRGRAFAFALATVLILALLVTLNRLIKKASLDNDFK